MTDIVEQLRRKGLPPPEILQEAATVIERLRANEAAAIFAFRETNDIALEEIERLRRALEPFARNVDAVSLSATLGHITREHLWEARRALEPKP